ncbi:ATP-binding protein [Labilibaculum sp.]|uniref:PAS domain-containing sensor histidine kinase n=1 Tax=Labilibaculum sp. TaxID=2060723 RepID=UPI00356928EE
MDKNKPTYKDLEDEVARLKRELKFQDKIMDNIPNPLFIKDENFNYAYCNKAFSEYLGIAKDKIINSSVYEISPKELADIFYAADCELRDKSENQLYETKVKYADGNIHDILFNKAAIKDEKNNFQGIVGIMLDITKRKKAEQELKKSKNELIEINKTKDKLLSIIAHDLRAPFNSILGFSELLIEDIEVFEHSESKENLHLINSTAKNTLVLLDNLLSWAKSQTGQLFFEAKRIVLSTIIEESIKNSEFIAKTKNINLHYFQTDKIEILGNENMMGSVFRNLISNAIKFTHSGGRINIYALKRESYVEICISDNGVGMNSETLEKLFDSSLNISLKGTEEEKGSGLGLLLCKEFVEQHGGKIWVESKEGKGSNFKFTLPFK